eukprot:3324563-Amphidinium_carterae.3
MLISATAASLTASFTTKALGSGVLATSMQTTYKKHHETLWPCVAHCCAQKTHLCGVRIFVALIAARKHGQSRVVRTKENAGLQYQRDSLDPRPYAPLKDKHATVNGNFSEWWG